MSGRLPNSMIQRLAKLAESQPVRTYLYTVALAFVGLLITLGLVSANTATAIVGVITAVLSVPAVEFLNKKLPGPPDKK